MERKIKFSLEAKNNTKQIISYLTREWSESIADKFILNFENKLKYINLFPYSFPPYEKFPDIRNCVLTKQISLYYKINNKDIEVLALFDTRQHPDKLKF